MGHYAAWIGSLKAWIGDRVDDCLKSMDGKENDLMLCIIVEVYVD